MVDLFLGRKRLADTSAAVVLLRDSSPNSRHIDCIFFVFCIKVSRFLPENMLK